MRDIKAKIYDKFDDNRDDYTLVICRKGKIQFYLIDAYNYVFKFVIDGMRM